MDDGRFDIAVVGGGIVGLSTALALLDRHPLRLVVLEAEDRIAAHQTGHNSGVVHSGLYYAPGSLRARLCVEGREALFRFCSEHGVACVRCGKVVVATTPEEAGRLEALERRGRENGLAGLRLLGAAELRVIEPQAAGIAALHVPETGVVDFRAVAHAFSDRIQARGGVVRTRARVLGVRRETGGLVLETEGGAVRASALVGCAGLHADRLARRSGVDPGARIVPFRGEYMKLAAERSGLVRHLIYPVPDPRFPFLGVHLTRTIHGEVEAGPNAVLALSRHGYRPADLSPSDLLEMVAWPGLWRMAARQGLVGLAESRRAIDRGAFLRAVRRLVPAVAPVDLRPAGSGVRAQALTRDGRLLDDFHVVEAERMLHVINAPSPAATASLAIGRHVAERALALFGLASTKAPGLPG